MKIAAILLAAGGSTRMGKLKQVLPVLGHPMARFCATQLLSTPIQRLIVVAGNEKDCVKDSLDNLDLNICHNPNWQKGIGGSIRSGVEYVNQNYPDCDGLLLALADQPTISIAHYSGLIQLMQSPFDIVASRYQQKNGVPVIFGRSYFDELLSITDSNGANSVIQSHNNRVRTIDLADYLDIDTPADYSKLIR